MPVKNVAAVSPNAANTNAFEHTVRARSFFRTFKNTRICISYLSVLV